MFRIRPEDYDTYGNVVFVIATLGLIWYIVLKIYDYYQQKNKK
jgi:hypothetical protein